MLRTVTIGCDTPGDAVSEIRASLGLPRRFLVTTRLPGLPRRLPVAAPPPGEQPRRLPGCRAASGAAAPPGLLRTEGAGRGSERESTRYLPAWRRDGGERKNGPEISAVIFGF